MVYARTTQRRRIHIAPWSGPAFIHILRDLPWGTANVPYLCSPLTRLFVKENMKITRAQRFVILAMSTSLLLIGCSDKSTTKATQVAAKVNGDEITVHQINFALSRLNNAAAAQNKDAVNQVLKGLVDKQLLVQQAIEEKLDRDPRVTQALEEGRLQILAAAYVDRLTQSMTPPTDDEIKAYYEKNPALFSDRRVYRLRELAIQTTPANVEEIKAKLAEAKDLTDLAEWLKARSIPVRTNQSVKPAEQLPLELVPRLQALREGQSLTLIGNNVITLVAVADYQSQPLTLEQAKPLIERYMVNTHKREMAEAKLKQLRQNARIDYKGDYAAVESTPVTTQPAAAEPVVTSEQEAIGKGLQGLK